MRGVWDGEAESRLIADEIERWAKDGRRYREMRHPGARLVPDARLRRALRAAADPLSRWSAARASSSAPRSATPTPICAWSSRRTTTWPSSASSTRPSAASATPRCRSCCSSARGARRLGQRGRRATWCAPTSWPAAHAHRAGQLPARPRPLARARAQTTAPSAPGRDHPRGERLHRRAAPRQGPDQPDPAGEPQGAGPVDGRLRHPGGLSRARRRWSWTSTARPATTRCRS